MGKNRKMKRRKAMRLGMRAAGRVKKTAGMEREDVSGEAPEEDVIIGGGALRKSASLPAAWFSVFPVPTYYIFSSQTFPGMYAG